MGTKPVRYSKRSIVRFFAERHKKNKGLERNPGTRCEMWKWAIVCVAGDIAALACLAALVLLVYWVVTIVTAWGWKEVKSLLVFLGVYLGAMVALVMVVLAIAFVAEAQKAIASSGRFARLKQTLCRPVELE